MFPIPMVPSLNTPKMVEDADEVISNALVSPTVEVAQSESWA